MSEARMSEYAPTTDRVLSYIRGNAVMDGASAVEAQEAAATWLAAVQREAAARALEEAAETFRVNTWLDLLTPASGMPGLSRNANAVIGWLRARAAEIREGGKE